MFRRGVSGFKVRPAAILDFSPVSGTLIGPASVDDALRFVDTSLGSFVVITSKPTAQEG